MRWHLIILSLVICVMAGNGKAEDAPPLRVVSLAPSLTETIFKLGRGNWLVGRTVACKYPADATKIPVVGDYSIPSMEKLAAAKPDIIVADNLKDPAMRETFAALKIKFYLLPSKRLDDYCNNVKIIGEILRCEAAAQTEITRIQQGLVDFSQKHPASDKNSRPRVLLMIWDNPLVTCGNHSFLNDYVNYAGGENIAGSENKAYFKCSLEWAIAHNPQVIIFPGQKPERLAELIANSGWSGTDAAKNKRVYGDITEDDLFILGPRLLEGIATLETMIKASSNDRLP